MKYYAVDVRVIVPAENVEQANTQAEVIRAELNARDFAVEGTLVKYWGENDSRDATGDNVPYAGETTTGRLMTGE